ncbi:MAG: hypothetical protein QG608_2121 [Actinomycetota bacterium]|nr:hypothetical protein [Actinomycetota bacterium]
MTVYRARAPRAARLARAALAGASIAAVTVLAGCGSSGRSSPMGPEPSLGPITQVKSPALVGRPLDAFLLSTEQTLRLERSRYRAMNRCLEQRGVSGRFEIPEDMPGFIAGMVTDRIVRSDLYGFFDVENVRLRGYHRPPSAPVSIDSRPPAGVSEQVVAECRSSGERAAAGVVSPTDLEILSKLPAGGPRSPLRDSRYERVVERWRTCMGDRGFVYSGPLAAIGDQRWRTPEPSEAERAVAVADVECKISTNLVGVALAVQAATDGQYLRAHAEGLKEHRARLLRAAGLA